MHPYALTILVHIWNCECFAGNIESGSKRFRQSLQTGYGSKSALMTLHPTHVYDNDVFIDHTHWRSKKEKVARTALLALNARSPSLLKHPDEVRY